MFRYAFLMLLLCCASSISMARDVQLHGANGDGGSDVCPEQATPASTSKRAPVTRTGKAKAPASLRGGDSSDAGVRAPRWHSFLPGMFR
jgi:hypothetical protein